MLNDSSHLTDPDMATPQVGGQSWGVLAQGVLPDSEWPRVSRPSLSLQDPLESWVSQDGFPILICIFFREEARKRSPMSRWSALSEFCSRGDFSVHPLADSDPTNESRTVLIPRVCLDLAEGRNHISFMPIAPAPSSGSAAHESLGGTR